MAQLSVTEFDRLLATHAPVHDPRTGYITACECGSDDRFDRDEDGNRRKDEWPAIMWARHVREAIRARLDGSEWLIVRLAR